MDTESFWDLLNNAVHPEEEWVMEGTDLADVTSYLGKHLTRLEKDCPPKTRKQLKKIRQETETVLLLAKRGYYIDGIQFGVRLMHMALSEQR